MNRQQARKAVRKINMIAINRLVHMSSNACSTANKTAKIQGAKSNSKIQQHSHKRLHMSLIKCVTIYKQSAPRAGFSTEHEAAVRAKSLELVQLCQRTEKCTHCSQ